MAGRGTALVRYVFIARDKGKQVRTQRQHNRTQNAYDALAEKQQRSGRVGHRQNQIAGHPGKEQQHQHPGDRRLLEIVAERPEKGLDHSLVPVKRNILRYLIQRNDRRAAGYDRDGADEKEKIHHDHLAHPGKEAHKGVVGIKQISHCVPPYRMS